MRKMLVSLALVMTVGCGAQAPQSSDSTPQVNWSALAQIIVTPNLTSVQAGELVNFACQGIRMDGTTTSPDVTWFSSNQLIATIDATGQAHGLAAGTVQISAQTVASPFLISTVTLDVLPIPALPAHITTTSLENGVIGVDYLQQQIEYGDGSGSPLFSIINGALPPGLEIDPLMGVITGVPTDGAGRRFDFTVQLVDGTGACTADLSITIEEDWIPLPQPLPQPFPQPQPNPGPGPIQAILQ